jgi:hypothetical protein
VAVCSQKGRTVDVVKHYNYLFFEAFMTSPIGIYASRTFLTISAAGYVYNVVLPTFKRGAKTTEVKGHRLEPEREREN